MKPSARLDLLEAIGTELQSRYTFNEIDAYLAHYEVSGVSISVNSKRIYAKTALESASSQVLSDIAVDLGIYVDVLHLDARDYLADKGLRHCIDDFERASKNIETDPDIAIVSACSTLESICKSIIDALGENYPSDQSISGLYKKVAELMKLSPGTHADADIKRILGGLSNAGSGLGSLRTKFSAAHGKGALRLRLEPRHARLAVNTCSTVGIFLIETYNARFANSVEGETV